MTARATDKRVCASRINPENSSTRSVAKTTFEQTENLHLFAAKNLQRRQNLL